MGKASRNKRLSAQEKIAAQRAAARNAERRRQLLLTGGSVIAVAVIVVVFVVVHGLTGGASGKTLTGTAADTVMKKIASVPPSTLAAVGAGTGQTNKPRSIPGTPLTQNGKPQVLYIGAEYCPYCAAERWALSQALSRFGTFSGVGLIRSSSTDVYANTPTLTFYKSSYASKYLSFTPVEELTVSRQPLQTATAQQQALLLKYDAPPYVPASDKGSIPFTDFANKFAIIGGSSYLPSVLSGLTWSQIATAMSNPASPVARQVDGAANYITAALCKVTNNQPSSVCTVPSITSLQGQIR
jgi:thiol-disulfide isomerase/thioredoxin